MKRSNLFFLLFHLVISMSITLHAQVTPSIEWEKSFGGSGNDLSNFIQQTTDGGFIVAGSVLSNDGDVTLNHGIWDYWIVKLDTAGNLVWQESLGGSGFDVASSIQQTNDNGFIVAGSSNSNDGNVTGNHGNFDYWVVKLNADQSIEWQKSLGGSEDDEAYSIQQITDGGFIIAGPSSSNNGDVSGNHGGFDCWVVKLDTAGNLIWQESLGGSSTDYANSVQQTTDGGFIIAGYSSSDNGNVSGNHGGYDCWIAKLDSGGNLVWQKSLGGTGEDQANSIRQIADGGFIIAGFSMSDDGDVSGNHGGEDYWIIKLDTGGNIIWQKSLGGSSDDLAYSVQQTTDDGFIVAGYTQSNDGDVSVNHSADDFWIVKLDTAGSIVWQKSLGGSNEDYAYSIEQTTDGGFIVVGNSSSNDYDVSGNHGNYDYWVVKLGSDIPTGIASPSNNVISLSPNPVQAQLTINLATPANEVSIRVYDLQGRMIALPTTFTNIQAQLNTTTLADGFYTLQIINNKTGEIEVVKFVKQQ